MGSSDGRRKRYAQIGGHLLRTQIIGLSYRDKIVTLSSWMHAQSGGQLRSSLEHPIADGGS